MLSLRMSRAFTCAVARTALLRSSFCRFKNIPVLHEAGVPEVGGSTLQFSKSRLVDFGELPFGEVPEDLYYDRPNSVTNVDNGVKIATEKWLSPLVKQIGRCSVSVVVKCGSRQETLETSSVAQFASHGAALGTEKQPAGLRLTRDQIEEKVDAMGGQLTIKADRELTTFSLTVLPEFQNDAVALLGEIVLKPLYDPASLDSIKGTLVKNATSMDPFTIVRESVLGAAYRDHFLGQPSAGIRENIPLVTAAMVRAYHAKHYVGENIVVSAAGRVNEGPFTAKAQEVFGKVAKRVEGAVNNSETPFVTHSTMFVRDDEITNSTFAVGFKAPTWDSPDYFGMEMFKRVIGEYRCDRYTGANLNASYLQHNHYHRFLGDRPGIYVHEPFYFKFSDTALFGNFIYGNEVFNSELMLSTQNRMSWYAQEMATEEVFRARNHYWNELLMDDHPEQVAFNNAQSLTYLNRLMLRSEVAKRVSELTPKLLRDFAHQWFYDRDVVLAGYGNLHNVIVYSYYSRPIIKSTLGLYSFMRVISGTLQAHA